ncbi:MAG: hypothetical protein AAF892_12855 [Cyanobacteria bacterium P01_D01_bin.71]
MTHFRNPKQRSQSPTTNPERDAPQLAVGSVMCWLGPGGVGLLMLGIVSLNGGNLFLRDGGAIAATSTPDSVSVEASASVSTGPALPTVLNMVPPEATTTLLAPVPADSAAEPPPKSDAVIAAPSRLWLIAMPAVPVVGGLLIYCLRKLSGKPQGDCQLVTYVAPPPSAPDDPPSSDDAP